MANVMDMYLVPFQKKSTPSNSTKSSGSKKSSVGSNATDSAVVPYVGNPSTSSATTSTPTVGTQSVAPSSSVQPSTPSSTLNDTPFENTLDIPTSQDTTTNTLATTDPDLQYHYDNLYAAQEESTIAKLKAAAEAATGNLTKSYNSALASFDSAQSGIKDSYYGKRNEAAAQSDIGAMNFAQYMAARGVKGNAGGMPEIYRNAGLQNVLGSLNTAETQDNAAIDTQRTLAKNNYNTDLDAVNNQLSYDMAGAGSDIEAAALQSKIELLKEAAAKATATTAADKQTWLETMGRYSDDYMAQITAVKGDDDVSNDWQLPYLEAARQDKINAQRQAEADAQAAALAAAQKSSYSGGSNSGSTQTFSQTDNAMQDIYNMNLDGNAQLTAAGKQALYNYATLYGGQYADQLLAKWGVTGSVKTTPTAAHDYSGTAAQAVNYKLAGVASDGILTYLDNAVSQGLITYEEGVAIGKSLGFS